MLPTDEQAYFQMLKNVFLTIMALCMFFLSYMTLQHSREKETSYNQLSSQSFDAIHYECVGEKKRGIVKLYSQDTGQRYVDLGGAGCNSKNLTSGKADAVLTLSKDNEIVGLTLDGRKISDPDYIIRNQITLMEIAFWLYLSAGLALALMLTIRFRRLLFTKKSC